MIWYSLKVNRHKSIALKIILTTGVNWTKSTNWTAFHNAPKKWRENFSWPCLIIYLSLDIRKKCKTGNFHLNFHYTNAFRLIDWNQADWRKQTLVTVILSICESMPTLHNRLQKLWNENHVKQKVKCANVFTEEINLWYSDFWREWIVFLFSLLVNCDWGWVVLRNSYAAIAR